MCLGIREFICRVALVVSLVSVPVFADSARAVIVPAPSAVAPVIVIGFLGGYVRHDAAAHSTVQLASRLRQDYPSGVYAEVVENHRGEKAHAEILRLMDVNGDGTLSAEEKRKARIVLYGHSWGASQALALARRLEQEGIPVLLTVQVDSVSKRGQHDDLIPANVDAAANFYQLDGLLHGRPNIRAADPQHTQIIGNFRFGYKKNPISCPNYPWFDRLFMKPHIEIECDPRVWNQVETLIRARLPQQP